MSEQGIKYHDNGSGDNTRCCQKGQGMRTAYRNEYARGYRDAMEDMRRRQQERQARRRYFFKQRALGMAVLLFTMIAVQALEGDITIALITVPLGLTLIFSRKKTDSE